MKLAQLLPEELRYTVHAWNQTSVSPVWSPTRCELPFDSGVRSSDAVPAVPMDVSSSSGLSPPLQPESRSSSAAALASPSVPDLELSASQEANRASSLKRKRTSAASASESNAANSSVGNSPAGAKRRSRATASSSAGNEMDVDLAFRSTSVSRLLTPPSSSPAPSPSRNGNQARASSSHLSIAADSGSGADLTLVWWRAATGSDVGIPKQLQAAISRARSALHPMKLRATVVELTGAGAGSSESKAEVASSSRHPLASMTVEEMMQLVHVTAADAFAAPTLSSGIQLHNHLVSIAREAVSRAQSVMASNGASSDSSAARAFPFRMSNVCVLVVPSVLLRSKLMPAPAARCVYLPARISIGGAASSMGNSSGSAATDITFDRAMPLSSLDDPTDFFGEQRARGMVRKWVNARVRTLHANRPAQERSFLLFALQHKSFSAFFTGMYRTLFVSDVLFCIL